MSLTVEKALQVIEALAARREPAGVSQLARELGLNKSTVYRLLDTLVRRGYVEQDERSGLYELGTKLWELGVGRVQRLEVRKVARPVLEAVARETRESTLLGVLQDHEALIIDKVDSREVLQIFSPVGARVPLYCSSLGRALLAYQPAAFIAEEAAAMTPRTPYALATGAALLAELERVRAEECSQSLDEWEIGVAGVASPIHDAAGHVIASICITGPTSRFSVERLPALRQQSIRAASAISEAMGYLRRKSA